VKINRKSVKANQFELLVLPFSDSRYRSTWSHVSFAT
jgi:hypothetical protein